MQVDLGRINGAAKHLLGLINDVLDLSKIEAGKVELHLEKFELAELVDQVVSTAPAAGRRQRQSPRGSGGARPRARCIPT